ncbi:MAG: M18 family aminopeptidase, partial [Erysipelotrichaceae bacterium]|nr:M18 family aminopeptidase [Erysipelotrichaceae bacterium]
KLGKKKIVKGKKYYLTRNGSSILAFNVGKKLNEPSLHITASHTDCPGMKLKPNPLIVTDHGVKLNVELYGGVLLRPWFDRPLSLAGRVMLNRNGSIKAKEFIDREPFCIIPSMAPHLDRQIEEKKPDMLTDMAPIVSLDKKFDLNGYLAKKLKMRKGDICGFDLYLYPLEKGYVWADGELFTCGHIDNLECAYTTLQGFINTFNDDNINLYVSFDNEEVGSLTRQGADSDLLETAIARICRDLGLDKDELLERAFMLSCDNAHAVHPNHPELYDVNNAPFINKGIVIKYNASQSYVTDSLSAALLKKILDDSKVPYQVFANKTGTRGGSTLGNISNAHVSILSADIGLAQWAMHSPVETAGVKDAGYMIEAVKGFYKAHLKVNDDESYSI